MTAEGPGPNTPVLSTAPKAAAATATAMQAHAQPRTARFGLRLLAPGGAGDRVVAAISSSPVPGTTRCWTVVPGEIGHGRPDLSCTRVQSGCPGPSFH